MRKKKKIDNIKFELAMQEAKDSIHQLANLLTAAMGYIEMAMVKHGEMKRDEALDFQRKALNMLKDSTLVLRRLTHMLTAVSLESAKTAAELKENADQAANIAAQAKAKADELTHKMQEVTTAITEARADIDSRKPKPPIEFPKK